MDKIPQNLGDIEQVEAKFTNTAWKLNEELAEINIIIPGIVDTSKLGKIQDPSIIMDYVQELVTDEGKMAQIKDAIRANFEEKHAEFISFMRKYGGRAIDPAFEKREEAEKALQNIVEILRNMGTPDENL